MVNKIHIVSFQIPYPPNYGGVIDVYYKIKALQKAGMYVILHTFYYDNRAASDFINTIADEVYYYKRKVGMLSQFSILPYIVKSRKNINLLNNLCKDNYPILFEGLHTCAWVGDEKLKNRTKLIRMHNVEYKYYYKLFKNSHGLINKMFFYIESIKLYFFERIINKAEYVLPISEFEYNYFTENYPAVNFVKINCFYSEASVDYKNKSVSDFCLFHGNLLVAENFNAALYLINNIAPKISCKLYIAGFGASKLQKYIQNNVNVKLIDSPSDDEMKSLVLSAKINILLTFQNTGIKLKLLHALNMGGYCVANDYMLNGTGLENACHLANNDSELVDIIHTLMNKDWSEELQNDRDLKLKDFTNSNSANQIIRILK